jgi:hypothetical protein
MLSNYESSSGLIHWLGQSPHYPITSQKPTSWHQAFKIWIFGGTLHI